LASFDDIALAVLYGSVARGQHDARSDVDLFIVFRSPRGQEKAEARLSGALMRVSSRIQPYITNLRNISKNDNLLADVVRDGIVVYARNPPRLNIESLLNVTKYTIFTYNLEGVAAAAAKRLQRALFGWRVKIRKARRIYKYSGEGIVRRHGLRLGKSAFIVESSASREVATVLRTLEVPYREFQVLGERTLLKLPEMH
jgi:hypothetical protein